MRCARRSSICGASAAPDATPVSVTGDALLDGNRLRRSRFSTSEYRRNYGSAATSQYFDQGAVNFGAPLGSCTEFPRTRCTAHGWIGIGVDGRNYVHRTQRPTSSPSRPHGDWLTVPDTNVYFCREASLGAVPIAPNSSPAQLALAIDVEEDEVLGHCGR